MTRNKKFLLVLERLKKLKGLHTDSDVGRLLKMTRQSICNYKMGDKLPFEALTNLCTKEGISIDWLLTGEGSMFGDSEDREAYVSIPLLSAVASAGPGRENIDAEITDYCKFKAAWVKKFGSHRHMALMTITGDSMEPTLEKGDVILINRADKEPKDGRIFVVNSGGSTVVKRIQLRGKGAWALSDNEKTNPPYQLDKDSHIIGRVVWFGRKLI